MAARPKSALTQEVTHEGTRCQITCLRSARPIAKTFRFVEPAIVFARGATRLELSITGKRITLDASHVFVVRAQTELALTTKSSTVEVLVVRPRAALIEATAAAYKIPDQRFGAVFEREHVFARQRWLDEVHHRYFFERIVCEKQDNIATAFLEMEIVKEVYFVLAQKESERGHVPFFEDSDDLGARAVRQVEANLFDPLSLDALAKTLETSRATLVRRFRERTGRAPAEYVRDRRLDEAKRLLERDGATVAEVGFTVGYENLSAFAQAYRRKFGHPPSQKTKSP
jgi:AraC-like DNA-binding protein